MSAQEKSVFRYTLNKNNKLSDAQRRFYEDNGYLVIPGLLDGSSLDRFAKRFTDICEGRIPAGKITVMKEISYLKAGKGGVESCYKLQDISWDPVFSDYITHSELLEYVESFVGPKIKARHSMLINKGPDLGTQSSRHPPHQDLFYFPFRPADRIVASWTAMERVTVNNGCLYVYPGSHKGQLLPHEIPTWKGGVNKGFFGILTFEDKPKTMMEMEPGDTVFFHPLLVHGSGLNTTKGCRKAISCHYAAGDCYNVDEAGYNRDVMIRQAQEISRKLGKEQSIQELWEVRARQVKPMPTSHL